MINRIMFSYLVTCVQNLMVFKSKAALHHERMRECLKKKRTIQNTEDSLEHIDNMDQADTLSDSEDDNCAIINGESDHEDSDRGPLHWNEAALQRPRALYQGDSRWTKRRKLLKQVAAAARMLLWGIHV